MNSELFRFARTRRSKIVLMCVLTVVAIGWKFGGAFLEEMGKQFASDISRVDPTPDPVAIQSAANADPSDTSTTPPDQTQPRDLPDAIPSGVHIPTASLDAPSGSTSTGPVTVESGGVASFGQQGGITAAKVEINPLPAERTWKLQIATCDSATVALKEFGPTKLSVGAFIANSDGLRVANVLQQCFQRVGWDVAQAMLPVDPDGVTVGGSVADERLVMVEDALRAFGFRVTSRDIRPAYGDSIGIVVGTNPILASL